jgi:hypothetical protein
MAGAGVLARLIVRLRDSAVLCRSSSDPVKFMIVICILFTRELEE